MLNMTKNKFFRVIWWVIVVIPLGTILLPFSLGLLIIDFLAKLSIKNQYKHCLIIICVVLITFTGVKWLNVIIFPQVAGLRSYLENLYTESATQLEDFNKADQRKASDNNFYEEAVVMDVIDGDTIILANGKRVRYIGMDTPELNNSSGRSTCYAKEARNKNRELVLGKKIKMEKDISEDDKYGRLLRYIYVDDVFVNKLLVEEGYAVAVAYPPDLKYQLQFKEAERSAFDNNLGLWGQCSRQPSDYNSAEIERLKYCVVKGNIEDGEKIFYYPKCPSYYDVRIDETAGEKWFCTEEEAKSFGWQKANECPWVPMR